MLRRQAVKALAGSEGGTNLLVVNTLDHPRREVVELPDGSSSVQVAANGRPLGLVSSPALGYAVGSPQNPVEVVRR